VVNIYNNVQTPLDKMKHDHNYGTAGTGTIYEFDTMTAWTIVPMFDIDTQFTNKIPQQREEDFIAHNYDDIDDFWRD